MLRKGKREWVITRRAAEDYGVNRSTLNKWCRSGKVECYRAYVPGEARETFIIERASLEKFIQSRRMANLEEVDI